MQSWAPPWISWTHICILTRAPGHRGTRSVCEGQAQRTSDLFVPQRVDKTQVWAYVVRVLFHETATLLSRLIRGTLVSSSCWSVFMTVALQRNHPFPLNVQTYLLLCLMI